MHAWLGSLMLCGLRSKTSRSFPPAALAYQAQGAYVKIREIAEDEGTPESETEVFRPFVDAQIQIREYQRSLCTYRYHPDLKPSQGFFPWCPTRRIIKGWVSTPFSVCGYSGRSISIPSGLDLYSAWLLPCELRGRIPFLGGLCRITFESVHFRIASLYTAMGLLA